MSFSYDCVLDHALRTHGSNEWSAKYGYALPAPTRITGHEHWDPPDVASSGDTIHLLKPHGSLNWQLPPDRTAEIKLKKRLHQQRGIPRFQ